MSTALVWLRNDLRVHDHAGFVRAAQCQRLCALYCFDPRHYEPSEFGSRKTGLFRAAFLIETLQDLQARLRSLGSDLLCVLGRPEDVVPSVARALAANVLFYHREITSEETTVERRVLKGLPPGIQVESPIGAGLYDLDQLPPSRTLPDGFTPWKQAIERAGARPCKALAAPSALPPSPALDLAAIGVKPIVDLGGALKVLGYDGSAAEPDARSAFPFRGGETAGLERVEKYFFGSHAIADYKTTRNGMIGTAYSTKFSPWLANGSLSARRVLHELRAYEEQVQSNGSTYWLFFELQWRDFFRYMCAKHGNAVFHLGGIVRKKRPWKSDPEMLARWKLGQTGFPLIDANMRELLATGFMSNRGRQNVASFLIHDMGLDWRLGADHFESLLLDHDPCSNWGSWVAAAGLLYHNSRINKFNPVKQGYDYDADGDYVRLWCPELAKIPADVVHQPWLLPRADRLFYGAGDYPDPIAKPPGFKLSARPPTEKRLRRGGGMARGQQRLDRFVQQS